MKTFKSAISSLLVAAILSCTGGNEKLSRSSAVADAVMNKEADEAGSQSDEVLQERKVIKRGEIRFQTKSIAETTDFIIKNVTDLKGYISSDNVYNSGDRTTQRIEIRIPSDSFDELLLRITENVRRVDYKNVQLQDVTEEYIDIESRIKTKKELENRYRELLSKARTVDEILPIEKELGTVRSEIESIEGRLKYLKSQVTLSTLTAEYYELKSSGTDFSSKLGQALVTGWRFLLNFIIGLVHLWPFIVIAVIIVFIVIRYNRKKKS